MKVAKRPRTAPTARLPGRDDPTVPEVVRGGNTAPKTSSSETRTGVAWSAGSKFAMQILQFGTTVVLARLLTPSDYGLVAIVLAFSGFAALFTDLGLGAAVIHRKDPDQVTLTTAFWLNALSGFALTGIFCALAYPLSRLYGEPRLVWLIVVSSFAFSLSMSTVHLALLERTMAFARIARVEFSAVLAYAVVAVVAAFAGAGPYSLVAGSLVQTSLTTILMWRSVRWKPSMAFSLSALRALWAFSGHLFGFNVLNYWSRNSDNLLVGKFLGPATLGAYARAYNLMMLPVQQVTGVVGRVLFPAYTRLRDDEDRLRAAYMRSVRVLAGISAPLSVGLAACATPFVAVVYGSRWTHVAPVLALLALSGPAQVISGTLGSLYQALGLTAVQLRRGIWATLVTVCAIVVGLHWGIMGVAVALVIKFWVLTPVNGRPAWRRIGISGGDLVIQIWPVMASSAALYGAAWGLGAVLEGQPYWLVLISQMLISVIAYLSTMAVWGRPVLREVIAGLTGRQTDVKAPHRARHLAVDSKASA